MKYSEVSKLFRLRNGLLERYYSTGWRVYDKGALDSNGKYINMRVGKLRSVKHRVIACLKYKQDLVAGDLVDHIDNDPHNNSVDNLQIVTAQVNVTKDWVYKLPRIRNSKYNASISITKAYQRVLSVTLGNYANKEHHKAITIAVRDVFVLSSSNPLREQFRDLVGAGQYGYAREIVQEYARALPHCTLR